MQDRNQKIGRWSVRPGSYDRCYVMALGILCGYTWRLIVLDGELAVP